MHKVVGLAVGLCGLTLGGCGSLPGLSAGPTPPLQVSTIQTRTQPAIHYGGYSSPDDDTEFVDPVPRYLTRTTIRQAAISPPKSGSASAPASQTRADPQTTSALRAPTETEASESPVKDTSTLSLEERERIGVQKREEAMRVMIERIAARDREAKRSMSGICNGC